MKNFGLLLIALLAIKTNIMAQDTKTEMLQMPVADSIANPIVLVRHSMGDINVKGHNGSKLLVYVQELLPSVSELVQQSPTKLYSFIDQKTKTPVTLSKNNNFSIEQRDNFFKIETNVYAFNNHIFVLAPERSSVAVHSRDIGNILIEDFTGNAEAEANNGSILIRNVDGIINATTVNGNVVADVTQSKEIKPLFISTLLGNIEIIAPQNAQNTVILSSELGNLRTNFDTINTLNVSTRNNTTNRDLTFNLNGGGTELILKTVKGDIYLRHTN